MRAAARRIAAAGSVAVFEDLGIQQAPNSTLCSYLNKLLWILTGNFAKKGGQHLHSSFAPLFSTVSGRTPVTGAPIIAGLVPANVGARGDPDRPPGPVPGHDRRKRQSRSLAGRFDRLPGGVSSTGTDGGRRRRDDRDGQTGPLRAARGLPVREAGSHLLQFRVPAQRLSVAPPAARAAARNPARTGDLGPAGARARRRRRCRPAAAARGRAAGPPGVHRGVPRRGGRQPDPGKAASLRALRNARTDAARRSGRGGRAVGAGPEDRDDLSRGRPARRSRRRQRAVRRDPGQPVRESRSPRTTTRTTSR